MKQERLQYFANELEKTRTELDLTQQEFAKKLDISLSAYKNMINGNTRKIDYFIFENLYKLTGKFAFEFMGGIDDYKLKIIPKLHDLTEKQLIYINAVAEFEKNFQLENEDVDDYITVFVPTGDMSDGMIYDTSNVEKLNIGKYRKQFGDRIHYAIKITSNHLHPAYNMGDILLIAKEPIRDGDVGLFISKLDGKAYIRKFRQTNPCRLEPVNDYGHTFEVDSYDLEDMSQWIKFGKILTKIR